MILRMHVSSRWELAKMKKVCMYLESLCCWDVQNDKPAPRFASVFTVAVCPFSDAKCKAVRPPASQSQTSAPAMETRAVTVSQ